MSSELWVTPSLTLTCGINMVCRFLAAITLLVIAPLAQSQVNIVCESEAADSDGDGFGWENGKSCRVTDESTDRPEFINQETGQPVSLIRAKWNAEDFYKDIICRDEYFDGSEYQTIRLNALLVFENLPANAPFQSSVRFSLVNRLLSVSVPWSLDNGIYTGPTALGFSPWVELVDFEFSNGEIREGVRAWTSDRSYTTCKTVNPDGRFFPTGESPTPVDAFNGNCIDTPPVGDGWGWNGFNSCSIERTATGNCFDSPPVGDGWGWNGTGSCRI